MWESVFTIKVSTENLIIVLGRAFEINCIPFAQVFDTVVTRHLRFVRRSAKPDYTYLWSVIQFLVAQSCMITYEIKNVLLMTSSYALDFMHFVASYSVCIEGCYLAPLWL